MSLEETRVRLISIFDDLANALERDSAWTYSLLRTISPRATASDELTKTIRALRTYARELPLLEGRTPYGDVGVALPFNNPLYSLVLYAFGPLLGGSSVVLRPSSITAGVVQAIADRHQRLFELLPLTLEYGAGATFLSDVTNSDRFRTLLFTGSWENLSRIAEDFPLSKTLIYCGSGIDPFVVSPGAFSGSHSVGTIVDLAVRSKLHNSGQDCLCAERFYVHRDLLDEFTGTLVEKVSAQRVGDFEDESADLVPLLGNLAQRLGSLLSDVPDSIITLQGSIQGSLVSPYVLQVPIDSPLLTTEKFGPVFVIAPYDDAIEVDRALDFDHRFGATTCGSYRSAVLDTYPHVTVDTSVHEAEAEDAHTPFGGRLHSGFVSRRGARRDGPILYSVETTQEIGAIPVLLGESDPV